MRLAVLAAVSAAVVASTSPAAASVRHDHRIDRIASRVAGFRLAVHGETSRRKWSRETAGHPTWVMGYTHLGRPVVHLSPTIWRLLRRIERRGFEPGHRFGDALGVLILVHEATHQRLHSLDEGRVNACALAVLPHVLRRDFRPRPSRRERVALVRMARKIVASEPPAYRGGTCW